MFALEIILYILAGAAAVAMSIRDFRERIIPDVFLFPFMLIGLILVGVLDGLPWILGGISESIIAGTIGYGLGTIINFAFIKFYKKSKKSEFDPIGMGDIKLLAAGGIWLGVTGLSIALISACILGGIWGLRKRQKFIPFAPFFFMGGIITIVLSAIVY
ncbi:MAG: A24 family peptidase [Alphaproteobacteria bacterium]|nr:A24 family peptidase [Alphaproteobacteria bacterium]